MRLTTRTIAALATTGLLATAAAVGTGTAASATTPSHSGGSGSSGHDRGFHGGDAVGLSADGKRLSTFSLKVPALARDHGRIAGLSGDARLVGIDWRVQDRTVYGVGDAGGVYTLDVRRAKATKVSQLTVALAGTHFGVDFNPAADRLRVISDTGQNLRHNPVAGGVTLVDGTLAYTPGTPATGLTAAAYTNNDLSAATGTTLVDLDTTKNQAAQQVPANDGTLLLAGPLGVDASPVAGFDIVSTVRDGVTVGNQGWATLRTSDTGKAALYRVDLLSGSASKVGTFRTADVADLAVVPTR